MGYQHDFRSLGETYHASSFCVAPLLLLPRLQKLVLIDIFDGLSVGDSDDVDEGLYVCEWEPRISTCGELRFYSCALDLETMSSFLSGMKTLCSINCVRGCSNTKKLLTPLLDHTGTSLENLKLDRYPPQPYDKCDWKRFEYVRSLDLNCTLLVDETTYTHSHFWHSPDSYPKLSSSSFGLTNWINLAASLPSSLETLRTQHEYDGSFESDLLGLLH